jgi:hypothetical protein
MELQWNSNARVTSHGRSMTRLPGFPGSASFMQALRDFRNASTNSNA